MGLDKFIPIIFGMGINTIIELCMIVVIIIATIIAAFISRGLKEKMNNRILDVLAIAIMLLYLLDLIMPIILGKIYPSRIPFTIGTLLAPLIIISRFVSPFDKYKSTVAMLSIIAMFVFLLYPNPILDQGEFNFRNIQIFNYFGLCFAYGVISISTAEVSFNIKKGYRTAICILLIEAWSLILKYLFLSIPGDTENARLISPIKSEMYGNIIYPSIIMVLISFLMCLVVFAIYKLILKIYSLIIARINKVEQA